MAARVSFSRGDIVVAASSGAYGKPRLNLVIQSDLFAGLQSVTVCPLTSDLREDAPYLRFSSEPNELNGLRQTSQIVIDKITTLPLSRVSGKIGVCDDNTMLQVTRALAVFLGVGEVV